MIAQDQASAHAGKGGVRQQYPHAEAGRFVGFLRIQPGCLQLAFAQAAAAVADAYRPQIVFQSGFHRDFLPAGIGGIVQIRTAL